MTLCACEWHVRKCEERSARIAELEAKLVQVRAWRADTLHGSGITVPDWRTLDAILDSKEGA